ncbi:MAG: DUF2310 family Zn-ribbon-containing protein [Verrucomicrobiales bacterium]
MGSWVFFLGLRFGNAVSVTRDKGREASSYHHSQICGEYFVTSTKGILNAHVLLAGPNAHKRRYHSSWAKNDLEKVIEAFGRAPTWTMLDDQANKRTVTWKAAPFLYLFTHAFTHGSPVCRGDGKGAIPIYKLPITFEQKDAFFSWKGSYKDHDHIWLGCGPLEVHAYRQLAEPESELSQHGRRLCQSVEDATGTPTFYFLLRYWARLKGEANRECPGCGRDWKVQREFRKHHFWEFDFKCENCRLVSHVGDSTDGGRKSSIGDFRNRS